MTHFLEIGRDVQNRVAVPSPEAERAYRQVLLFISPPGAISDAMMAAIEHEFDWLWIIHVPDPQSACVKLDAHVKLIMIDQAFFELAKGSIEQLRRYHPGAVLALMADGQPDRDHALARFTEEHDVAGVLPTDVNLDLWLSIIRILLKGGVYFPPTFYGRLQGTHENLHAMRAGSRHFASNGQEQRSRAMHGLTERELEILALVSRGHQNKSIAFELQLSEHTVKVHLHNIIKKLRVNNRTEAAAKYFTFTSDSGRTGSVPDEHDSDGTKP